jgi:hypothetical protein
MLMGWSATTNRVLASMWALLYTWKVSHYTVLVGGANGDMDLLELIDGRSYKLQWRSVSRTRETDFCMGEGLLTQRS